MQMNEKLIRFLIFIFVAALHLAVILFLVFETEILASQPPEHARVMRLIDLEELPPPPPPPPPPVSINADIPQVEAIAEVMIETDFVPEQEVVAAGTLHVQQEHTEENFLPMHLVSTQPIFDEAALASDLIYPPIALRSGIEGRVILDLFVDRTGTVQRVTILREEPEGRGFGEAAVRAFTGRRGIPATSNGTPVSCRFRYPVTFRIR